ncbi:P2Y purinoceptor 14-like isoform X2 [Acanthochromis polyacanthus]|nr:P2Y purinoceptor 14-like isoform X2 [Acanthochromis polyacanthus]
MSSRVGIEDAASFNQSSGSNQTEADSWAPCRDYSIYPFLMVVYGLVFLIGSILNGFILKFYFCQAQQQASSTIMVYLKNLAAADFLLCLSIPLRITNYVSRSATVHLVHCNFGATAFYTNMYASILFMGFIAANRYLKIVRPRQTRVRQRVWAAHIVCTVTWVFLLTLMSAYIILSVHTQKPLTSIPNTLICELLHNDQHGLVLKFTHSCSAVIFLVVLISLLFFYYSTSRRVLLAQKKQPLSSSSTMLKKSHRNMLVLVSVFCFCFVPYHLVRLLHVFLSKNCTWSKVLHNLTELTVAVSVLNVCLDPLIYFIFCKAFRTQLTKRAVCTNP